MLGEAIFELGNGHFRGMTASIPDHVWSEIVRLVAGSENSPRPLWARVEARRICDRFPGIGVDEAEIVEAIFRLAARRGTAVDNAL
jgi:hypothetical protein